MFSINSNYLFDNIILKSLKLNTLKFFPKKVILGKIIIHWIIKKRKKYKIYKNSNAVNLDQPTLKNFDFLLCFFDSIIPPWKKNFEDLPCKIAGSVRIFFYPPWIIKCFTQVHTLINFYNKIALKLSRYLPWQIYILFYRVPYLPRIKFSPRYLLW